MQIAVMNLTSILIDQLRSRLRQDASIAVRAGWAGTIASCSDTRGARRRRRARRRQGVLALVPSRR